MTKILLVEDHEELWDFLSRRLKRRGFDVVLAHDGQQGVDVAHAEKPDVILLDMNLPDGNGLTLAQELSAGASAGSPSARRRPVVIAVTASVLPQDRAAAMAAGCDGFLDKPYAAADLVAVIAEHLAARAATA